MLILRRLFPSAILCVIITLLFLQNAIATCAYSLFPDTLVFPSCPNAPTVKDHQGNVYHTVLIGTQCWMRENMRCTTSPTGKKWTKLSGTIASAYTPNYVDPQNSLYGILYSWAAALDTFNVTGINAIIGYRRGICPKGWHIPTNAEWGALITYLGGEKSAGQQLKSTSKLWNNIRDYRNTNASGFSAMPAGFYFGGLSYIGVVTGFWTSTRYNNEYAFSWYLNQGSACTNNIDNKANAYSVRCKKNQ